MNVSELFDLIRIDGKPIGKILQVQIDTSHATIIYQHQVESGEVFERAITVESEAVTIG